MTSPQSQLVIVNLKTSYRENKSTNYRMFKDIESAMSEIMDKSTCTLEVLSAPIRRIYLDVENIPTDKPEIIEQLITKLKAFLHIPDCKECLTHNKNSTQHSGLSYHVILPYKMHIDMMKKMILYFKELNPEYEKFIDPSVYSRLRLMRLPYNAKVTGSGLDENDYHELVRGTMADAIIQDLNVPDSPLPDGIDDFKTNDADVSISTARAKRKREFKFSGSAGLEEIADKFLCVLENLNTEVKGLRKSNEEQAKINDQLFEKLLFLEKRRPYF